MIRPSTFVCALMAFGSGLYLYQSKHGAQLLDRQIAQTVHDTALANDRIKVLGAEWQLLNEPERLQGLAQQYLPLRPMAPTQVAAVADLAGRLPAALPASAYAPPSYAPPSYVTPGTVEEPAPALPAAPGVPPPATAPALVASVAPRTGLRATASIAFPPATPAPVGAQIVTASAGSLMPRPVADHVAAEHVADRTGVDRAGADRAGADPQAVRTPKRTPDAPTPHAAPPLTIGPAVAAPLAPAVPLTPRPALVQRIATSVPAPGYAPGYAPSGPAAVSAVAFPSAPPAVASALGMAAHGSLLPPPVPVH